MKRRDLTRLTFLPLLGACGGEKILSGDKALRNWGSLPREEKMTRRGFSLGAPVFLRIFKEDRILELWMSKAEGRYALYRRFPICFYSGELGPKVRAGDKQAPEGFYRVELAQLNPHSRYHRSFNLGYPNAYDRAHGYTGALLMVHGKCVSVGCYAMGDEQIEILYRLVEAALKNGQPFVPVHIFPFPLRFSNLERHKHSQWYDFWKMLKPGYDYFENYATPPFIRVVSGRYEVDYIRSIARQ